MGNDYSQLFASNLIADLDGQRFRTGVAIHKAGVLPCHAVVIYVVIDGIHTHDVFIPLESSDAVGIHGGEVGQLNSGEFHRGRILREHHALGFDIENRAVGVGTGGVQVDGVGTCVLVAHAQRDLVARLQGAGQLHVVAVLSITDIALGILHTIGNRFGIFQIVLRVVSGIVSVLLSAAGDSQQHQRSQHQDKILFHVFVLLKTFTAQGQCSVRCYLRRGYGLRTGRY